MAAAIGAYSIWGLFPAFWPLLAPAVPVEVLAHRIMWTAVLMVVVIVATRGWYQLRALRPRGWGMVAAAGALITVNWGLYIYAVFAGHVVEAALGYFMSPLVSVLLGVLVLRERLRMTQWVAVGLGAVAVVVITVEAGQLPWIGLGLASSFGVYGLLKSMIPLTATAGVAAEAFVLAPFAVAAVAAFEISGTGTFTGHGVGHILLLVVSGLVTAVPLMLYGAAARRVPLSTVGVLMYLNPILQFLWGVLVVGEAMPPTRWIGFVLVWIALVVFTGDLVRSSRTRARVPIAV